MHAVGLARATEVLKRLASSIRSRWWHGKAMISRFIRSSASVSGVFKPAATPSAIRSSPATFG